MKRQTDGITALPTGFRNGHSYIHLFMFCVCMLFACCSHDEDEIYNPGGVTGVTEKMVNFHIAVPYVAPAGPQTRAIGAIEENTIDNIDVLAFKVEYEQDGTTIRSETFDYSKIGTKSTGNTEGAAAQSFNVTVKVKDYKQRFVIIANAEEQVASLTGDPAYWVGKDKATMLAKLEVALEGSEDRWEVINTSTYTKFPIWGESGTEMITGATTRLTSTVLMLRMIAKINVQLDETVLGLTDKFEMTSVYLYNTNTKGNVVPSAITEETRNSNRYLYVTAPTIPQGATICEGPIEYTDFSAPGTPGVAMKGAIYTFETKAPTAPDPAEADRMKATCLVIGGKYAGDTDITYYRVDFFESDGIKLRDILRNHQYVVNITDVKGRGHESVDVAFKSKSVNMKVETLYWNEAGLGNVDFDGQNILSVSQDKYTFARDAITAAQDNNLLDILTDYQTDATGGISGWYVEKIVDAHDDSQTVTWVQLTPDNGVANVRATAILTVLKNDTPQERSAVIWIAAGRLRYPVTVSQTLNSALGIQLAGGSVNAAGQTELVFVSTVGVAPASQPLTVNWQPKDADLIVSSMVIGANGFPSGVGEPNGNIAGGNGGTGTVTYTIQPAGFTSLEVDEWQGGNPFLEKVSKVDFVTGNGINYTAANVFLRQISYNLLTDVRDGYMLDAQTETLKVRANFGWTITAVADPDNILQDGSNLIGRAGGNNTTTGDAVNFTMVAEDLQAPKTGKTATITFTNMGDGSTWDVVITAGGTLYVGYFGGALVETNGVWQFERPLYVQSKDESEGRPWGDPDTFTTGLNNWDGKSNTYAMNSTAHPAAYLCMQKNGVAIGSISDPNYNWYLPAQNQLMAVWVVQTSFDLAYQLTSESSPWRDESWYWTSTEYYGYLSRYVSGMGETASTNKDITCSVRCVRELP